MLLFLFLLLPLLAVSEYCYSQYCFNYDGSHIWCDQSEYLCTEGDWYWQDASCEWVGQDGGSYWSDAIWCSDDQSCETDWSTGEPYCMDWGEIGDAVEAGMNMITTIIICVVVGVVVLLVGCCVCCFYMGKGCCKRRDVHPGTAATVNVNNNPPAPVTMATTAPVTMPTVAGGQVYYNAQGGPPQYPSNQPQYPSNQPVPNPMVYNSQLPDPTKIRPM